MLSPLRNQGFQQLKKKWQLEAGDCWGIVENSVTYKLKSNTPASFGKGPNLLDDFQIPAWK